MAEMVIKVRDELHELHMTPEDMENLNANQYRDTIDFFRRLKRARRQAK